MKKITLLSFLLLFSFYSFCQVTITPLPFEVNESITITVDENSNATDCNGFNNPAKIYLHSGIGDDSDPWGYNVIGNWGQDDGVGEMTDMGGGLWSITFIPEDYYMLNATQASNAIKMGMVFRNEDGTQEFKDNTCDDFYFDVGSFQVSLSNPTQDSVTVLNSGDDLSISATNIGGNANYVLKANGATINTQNNVGSYSFTDMNITENKVYALEVTLDGTTITKSFSAIIDPGTTFDVMPQSFEDGITYDDTDPTKATLVLYANGKDFVYVAGSFNNYQPDLSYAMKRDPTRNNKFWITLTGLTPGQIETYQYWAVDKTPLANSPQMVKTADPYSTLVLSPFDDPWIPASSYPNIPSYPDGQEREVTVLQTDQTEYNWQIQNFTKPKKEDLIIYEVLIRDFDANRNYQDLIDRIEYFKDLNINAIELMPVMEYEGNESWGYNTSFHMALDKFYGTEDKFKEFVDLCHQNGIAVILDLAINHAFGRNPMVRLWMDDPENDGWGDPSTENPYFNTSARHSYSVGSDFNHSSGWTKLYTKRVIKHWIEEFKIDGFRWDLTKGFTQNCGSNDEGCTNGYQADRVAVLKEYADYSWSLDPDHYVIFEHLGGNAEESEWANYRVGEGKGIMLWGKMTDPYNQLTMGYNSSNNINGMGHNSRGFNEPRLVGYAESHDEERLMYKNLQFGNSTNGSHDITNLNTALSRMSALGAVSLTIPGPKMIWHFGELGMENSIFTCNNGTVNEPGGGDGDCKLDTKPQPQWTNGWPSNSNRNQIYNDWSRLNQLKIEEPVFEGDYTITSGNLTPRIDIFDNSLPTDQLRNVIVLANFDVVSQNVSTSFPTGGTWYDLMDETGTTTISGSTSSVNIPPGQFRIFGNQPSTLNTDDFDLSNSISVYPNPTNNSFSINASVSNLTIYDLTGKKVKEFIGEYSKGYSFDISSLTKSMYLVQIKNNSGAMKTTKLIKL